MKVRRKLALILPSIFLLVLVPAAIGIYSYSKQKILTNESIVLKQETHAFITLRTADLLSAEGNLTALARLLQKRLEVPLNSMEISAFDGLIEQNPDGAWRSKHEAFLIGNEAGIFLPPNITLNEPTKRLYFRAKRVLDAFSAPAIHPPFNNVWMLTHDKSEIIFDKKMPDYVWQMPADTDYTKTHFFTLGSPDINPNHQLIWTKPTYDPVAKAWLVSAVYPFYNQGVWVGTLGQDIDINQAFPELFSTGRRYEDEHSFLLDRDGHFILAGPWQKTLLADVSAFSLNEAGEPDLVALLSKRSAEFEMTQHAFINFQGQPHVAIKEQMPLLGWTYYKLVPVNSILAPMKQLFYSLLAAMIGIMLILAIFVREAINQLVIKRIEKLTFASAEWFKKPDATEQQSMGDEIDEAEQGLGQLMERLNVSERDFRLIMSHIPTTIAYLTPDLTYQYVNPRYELMYGKAVDWIVGKTVLDLVGETQYKTIAPYFEQALAGANATFEHHVLTPSGVGLNAYVQLIPNFDQNHKVIGLYVIGLDVTELKASQATSASAQDLLRMVIDITPVQIFWKDRNSRYLGCNQAFAKDAMLDSPADIIGKSDIDLLWGEFAEKFQLEDQEVMRTGQSMLNYEHSLLRPNGEVTWSRSSKVPLRNQEGEIIGLLGVDEDITQNRKMEVLRREESARFEKIINRVPSLVFQLNKNARGRYALPFVNDAITAYFRSSAEELKNDASDIFKTIHPDDRDDIIMSLDISARDLTYWYEEFRVRFEDKTEFWYMVKAMPEQVADGVLWYGVVTDITERKMLENALIEAESRWKFAVEGTGDGVWDVNVQTEEAIYSKRWFEMSGYAEGDIEPNSQAWSVRIHPEDIDQVRAAGKAYLNGETDQYITEYRFLCKDGQYKWMLSRGMIVSRDEQGKPLRVIGTQIDITERKNAQLLLQEAREKLELSHHQFKDLYEFAPIGYMTIGMHGLITQLNWRAASIFGLQRRLILNQRMTQFVADEDRTRWTMMFTELKDASVGDELSFDLKLASQGHTERYINLNCIRMDDVDAESLLRITFDDVTQLKKSEAELRIAAIAFESQDGLLITDAENRILKVNHALTKLMGYTIEELEGKSPSVFNSGVHDDAFYHDLWSALNHHGQWRGEIWNRQKTGGILSVNLTITAVKSDIGIVTNYVASYTDMTKIKEANNQIKMLSNFDTLTSLPNRRLLTEGVAVAIDDFKETAKQSALFYIDLDHFKALNDTLDYGFGDKLLQEAANRLITCIQDGDMVARFGGDEFVVLITHLNKIGKKAKASTEEMAQKMMNSLQQSYRLNGQDYHLTVSVGVTMINHVKNADLIIKEAEIAMYQAKEAGRNGYVFFSEQMQHNITKRVGLERELRNAISNQEFQLYYQPQFNEAGYVIGVEALIRWHRPQFGMVPPHEFIPIAEETGLIVEIGNWTINQACLQLKEWQQHLHTRSLSVAINVSAKQFHSTDFYEQVKSAIDRHGVDPMLLKLELTETVLLSNFDDAIACMQALAKIGVLFSLDDFGTGYSSLQYLKKLPLYQLKIDQSFVHDIVTDHQDRLIIRTIIAMAESLYLNVIAEGVETPEQQQLLLIEGCKQFQGYLLAKPLPSDALEAFLKTNPIYIRPNPSGLVLSDGLPLDRLN